MGHALSWVVNPAGFFLPFPLPFPHRSSGPLGSVERGVFSPAEGILSLLRTINAKDKFFPFLLFCLSLSSSTPLPYSPFFIFSRSILCCSFFSCLSSALSFLIRLSESSVIMFCSWLRNGILYCSLCMTVKVSLYSLLLFLVSLRYLPI